MAASLGAEQDEMRRRHVFDPGSGAPGHRPCHRIGDLHPADRRRGRSAWLAATLALGLLSPAAGFAQGLAAGDQGQVLAQISPRPVPPAPRPGGSDHHPYKPSYGRWSPGQVLPPTAGAVEIVDYEQFHLRKPPLGYTWMQCDGDYILANAAGLIFEVIPGGGR
jgi:Ni/Co efflux regulator RcnB